MLLLDAMICPMDGPDIARGYIRVGEAKIAALGPMDAAPEPLPGEEVVKLNGKTVLPGLIDPHCHVGLGGPTGDGAEISEESAPLQPQLRVLDGIDPQDAYFAEALRAGVTCAVVSPGSVNPVGGQICAVKTHAGTIDDMLVRSPVAIKMALGENPVGHWRKRGQPPGTRMAVAAMIRGLLDRAKGKWGGDEASDAMKPLLHGEIAAHIHAHSAQDISTALRLAEEYGFRCVIVHGTEAPLLADMLAKQRIDVICGPMINTRTKAELQNLDMRHAGTLQRAGVRVAVCTDHPEVPVNLLALSAALAAAHGLSRAEALAAVTINAARIAGLGDRLGSITPGKDADLIVYSGDPLAVGAVPDLVMIDGKWISS